MEEEKSSDLGEPSECWQGNYDLLSDSATTSSPGSVYFPTGYLRYPPLAANALLLGTEVGKRSL